MSTPESAMELARVLTDLGLTHAEHAVLWHVRDTVVIDREGLASWVSENLPNDVPQDISVEDCRRAVETLLRNGLLVELTEADLSSDLARWDAESIPISQGVDRNRCVGAVDLTESGFRAEETISRLAYPSYARGPAQGYNDEQDGVIRVFGETEEACRKAAARMVDWIDHFPWQWQRGSVYIEAIRQIGPWWFSRFERVPTGFEICVRRLQN